MSDLLKLSKPFPAKLVKKPPKGKYGSYVKHSTIAEALLATVGAYDLQVKQVIRGYVPELERTNKETGEKYTLPAIENCAVGVIAALTLNIDGRAVTVEEVGDCDDPHNWTHDGQRLKDAVSDAVKRCAMRFGLGLHLWSQENYFLYDSLSKKEAVGEEERSAPPQADDASPAAPQATAEARSPAEAASEDPASLVAEMTEKINNAKKNKKSEGGVPSPEEEGAEGPGQDVRPSPILTAKRAHFRSICTKANVDPDECAQEVGAISLEACNLEQLEALISQRGAA